MEASFNWNIINLAFKMNGKKKENVFLNKVQNRYEIISLDYQGIILCT